MNLISVVLVDTSLLFSPILILQVSSVEEEPEYPEQEMRKATRRHTERKKENKQ